MSADLAIINVNIKTQNPAQPTAQALAVKSTRIIKVGSNRQIQSFIAPTTRVLDLGGKTVVPGFIDTHIHVADYGRCLMWLDLTSAKSIADLQRLLREKAQRTPVGRWIIGQGWNENRFQEHHMPSAEDLDAAAPDNPVVLYREAAMTCAVNTPALKLAGVNGQTAPPSGGAIDKTPAGNPTGILRDAATSLIWQAVPEPSPEELLDAAAVACQKIAEAGITGIHWLVISESELPLIRKLHEQGKLPFRVNVVVPEAMLPQTSDFPQTPMLHVGGCFIVADGYLDSKEAAMVEPYSDEPANQGKLLLTEAQLEQSIKNAVGFGVQPVIHAMGDRAIAAVLEAIENSAGNHRVRIEQAAVLNPQLLTQLKASGAIVTVQPKVISTEFNVWTAEQRLGDRASWLHPIKTLLDAGIRVAAGSDCPMEPLSALLGVQELVTRKAYPEQRLSVDEALQLYTLNAAYCSGEETLKGSVEEGKLADLTVLSADLDSVLPEKISEVTVDLVVLNGRVMVVTLADYP
ncbi:MAG: amidohydrolase [Candidatus Bathyarchaeota archaeon]|nr:amidohydrolase [Candidatus Bathyarchaeota archaeon]